MAGWHHQLWEMMKDKEAWHAAIHGGCKESDTAKCTTLPLGLSKGTFSMTAATLHRSGPVYPSTRCSVTYLIIPL